MEAEPCAPFGFAESKDAFTTKESSLESLSMLTVTAWRVDEVSVDLPFFAADAFETDAFRLPKVLLAEVYEGKSAKSSRRTVVSLYRR